MKLSTQPPAMFYDKKNLSTYSLVGYKDLPHDKKCINMDSLPQQIWSQKSLWKVEPSACRINSTRMMARQFDGSRLLYSAEPGKWRRSWRSTTTGVMVVYGECFSEITRTNSQKKTSHNLKHVTFEDSFFIDFVIGLLFWRKIWLLQGLAMAKWPGFRRFRHETLQLQLPQTSLNWLELDHSIDSACHVLLSWSWPPPKDA